jgi:uncharacterized membrane protein (DUF2068 family)
VKTHVSRRSDALLHAIAVLKLLKGAALVAVALGLLSHRWLHDLHPNHRVLREAIATITAMSPHTQTVVAIATFVYAALFVTEGVGLLLSQLWAEYLTTIITMSFVPVELYEVLEHGSPAKAVVLVLNVLIVIYLVWRLRREHHWPFRQSSM